MSAENVFVDGEDVESGSDVEIGSAKPVRKHPMPFPELMGKIVDACSSIKGSIVADFYKTGNMKNKIMDDVMEKMRESNQFSQPDFRPVSDMLREDFAKWREAAQTILSVLDQVTKGEESKPAVVEEMFAYKFPKEMPPPKAKYAKGPRDGQRRSAPRTNYPPKSAGSHDQRPPFQQSRGAPSGSISSTASSPPAGTYMTVAAPDRPMPRQNNNYHKDDRRGGRPRYPPKSGNQNSNEELPF